MSDPAAAPPFPHRKNGLDLTPAGLGWRGEPRENPWDRLPLDLKTQIPENLWNLGTQSAGVYLQFRSAATQLRVRWKLQEAWPYAPNTTGCGISGFDLYGRDAQGHWRWAGSVFTGNPAEGEATLNRMPLDGHPREYRLYLPLRRRVLGLEMGSDAEIVPLPRDPRPPLAYYATSIVHGEGVGRPGMTQAALVARHFDVELLNLGFCGSARCEPAIAAALARLDPRLYLIDVLPNNSAAEAAERIPPLLDTLRTARPHTPILLLGDRIYGDATFCPVRDAVFSEKNQTLAHIFADAQRRGMQHLHLHLDPDWYGEDREGTTDASHPNDLGAWRMAQKLIPLLAPLLA